MTGDWRFPAAVAVYWVVFHVSFDHEAVGILNCGRAKFHAFLAAEKTAEKMPVFFATALSARYARASHTPRIIIHSNNTTLEQRVRERL